MEAPLAIVWGCSLSVSEYEAAGKLVEVPELTCHPSCGVRLRPWSWYERRIREGGEACPIWIRRGRCPPCAVTHALLPDFVHARRLDAVEVIGKALEMAAQGVGTWRVLFRYRVIAEALSERLTPAEQGLLVRGLASCAHEMPDGSRKEFSRATLVRTRGSSDHPSSSAPPAEHPPGATPHILDVRRIGVIPKWTTGMKIEHRLGQILDVCSVILTPDIRNRPMKLARVLAEPLRTATSRWERPPIDLGQDLRVVEIADARRI